MLVEIHKSIFLRRIRKKGKKEKVCLKKEKEYGKAKAASLR